MMPARRLAAIAMLGAACGCHSLPAYRHRPGADTARITLAGSGEEWMCFQGQAHALQGDAAGYADIPAGARVTVGSRYNQRGGRCSPSASFIPKAGQRYHIDLQLAAEHCHATVYIEDPGTMTGLLREPSARPARGCDL